MTCSKAEGNRNNRNMFFDGLICLKTKVRQSFSKITSSRSLSEDQSCHSVLTQNTRLLLNFSIFIAENLKLDKKL